MGSSIECFDANISQSEIEDYGINVSNITASFDLEGEYDRTRLAEDLKNAEYDPNKHRSLIFRSSHIGNFTILLPPSGRVSIAGAKSAEDIHDGISEFLSELNSLGINPDHSQVQVENIVATADLGRQINLEKAILVLGLELTEYEPEQFPGVIYRQENGPVTLIFHNGKMVITKADTYEAILEGYHHVRRELNDL